MATRTKRKCERERAPVETEPFAPALPFQVHRPGVAPRSLNADVEDMQDFVWEHAAQSVAEEALERGYVLSVPMPACWAVQATSIICAHLTCNVYARYDEIRHVLILWHQDAGRVTGRHLNAATKESN